MKMDFRAIAILSFLLLTCQSALAATASGSSAFALASLVAVHSPVLSTGDTVLIRRLFNGHFHQLRGDTKPISVDANAIVCSVGNVDLTAHSCKLTFGSKTINLTGDKAYELYATMSQAGVPSEGRVACREIKPIALISCRRPPESSSRRPCSSRGRIRDRGRNARGQNRGSTLSLTWSAHATG
jgi:hypothetical protein